MAFNSSELYPLYLIVDQGLNRLVYRSSRAVRMRPYRFTCEMTLASSQIANASCTILDISSMLYAVPQ
jgi:hypothetical protein